MAPLPNFNISGQKYQVTAKCKQTKKKETALETAASNPSLTHIFSDLSKDITKVNY